MIFQATRWMKILGITAQLPKCDVFQNAHRSNHHFGFKKWLSNQWKHVSFISIKLVKLEGFQKCAKTQWKFKLFFGRSVNVLKILGFYVCENNQNAWSWNICEIKKSIRFQEMCLEVTNYILWRNVTKGNRNVCFHFTYNQLNFRFF